MNIVFGKTGQLGQTFKNDTSFSGYRFVGRDECDFADPSAVKFFLNSLQKPDIIINACAYTKVDLAESNVEECYNVNAVSVGVLADFCKENNVTLVHYSTDYVFDGSGDTPFKWDDYDKMNPVNEYGKAKLAGENAVRESGCNHYIIRTSWVYSEYGSNFLKTMSGLMRSRKVLGIVSDQVSSPTYTKDIVDFTIYALESLSYGTYHFSNAGFCSWYDFACQIKHNLLENEIFLENEEINLIPTSEYKTPAARPLNSRLEPNHPYPARDWKVALQQAQSAFEAK